MTLTLTLIIFILQPSVDSLAQSGANGDSDLLFDVSLTVTFHDIFGEFKPFKVKKGYFCKLAVLIYCT